RCVGRQIAARKRGADLQSRKSVERAFEDQVRRGGGAVERIADRALERALAEEPARGGDLARALRVNENQHAELFGLGPERVQLLVGEVLVIDAGVDQRATHPKLLYRVLQLLDSEPRVLQGNRGQPDKTFGLLGADFRQLLVLQLDNPAGEV